MKLHRLLLALSLFTALSGAARAELVVVSHPRSGVERLSEEEVVNIFLGRYRQFSSGLRAVPIDQPVGSEAKANFYRALVGKEPSEINAYWARLVFSGKTSPPLQMGSPAEILQMLLTVPGSIAYMERAQVDSRLRILFDLPRYN